MSHLNNSIMGYNDLFLARNMQAEIISELEGHILECVKDNNGNHVIQKCIRWADPILLQSIVASFTGKVSLPIYCSLVIQGEMHALHAGRQACMRISIHLFCY